MVVKEKLLYVQGICWNEVCEKTFVLGCMREKAIVGNQTDQMIGIRVVEIMRKTLHVDKDFVVEVGQTFVMHHIVIKIGQCLVKMKENTKMLLKACDLHNRRMMIGEARYNK